MSSFRHHHSFPSLREDASSIKKNDVVKNSSFGPQSQQQQRKPFQRLNTNQQQQPSSLQQQNKAHQYYKPKSIVSATTTDSSSTTIESRGPIMTSEDAESEFELQLLQQHQSELEHGSMLSENRTQPDLNGMEEVFRRSSWLQVVVTNNSSSSTDEYDHDVKDKDSDDLHSMWTLKRANPITEFSDDEEEAYDELAAAYASPTKRSRRTQLDWENWLGEEELLS